jgi:hypothetical protein
MPFLWPNHDVRPTQAVTPMVLNQLEHNESLTGAREYLEYPQLGCFVTSASENFTSGAFGEKVQARFGSVRSLSGIMVLRKHDTDSSPVRKYRCLPEISNHASDVSDAYPEPWISSRPALPNLRSDSVVVV